MKKLDYFDNFEDVRIKVCNLESPKTGNRVENQFCIFRGSERRFQSYETTCLIYNWQFKVLTVFPEAFGYSRTTSKYSKVFLSESCGFDDETVENIKKMAKTESFGRDCPLYIQL